MGFLLEKKTQGFFYVPTLPEVVWHEHNGCVDVLQLAHRVVHTPHEHGQQRLTGPVQKKEFIVNVKFTYSYFIDFWRGDSTDRGLSIFNYDST